MEISFYKWGSPPEQNPLPWWGSPSIRERLKRLCPWIEPLSVTSTLERGAPSQKWGSPARMCWLRACCGWPRSYMAGSSAGLTSPSSGRHPQSSGARGPLWGGTRTLRGERQLSSSPHGHLGVDDAPRATEPAQT